MISLRYGLLFVAVMSLATFVSAETLQKYGDAEIVKGGMTIVRNGKKVEIIGVQKGIQVKYEDVIWVHNNSKIVLETNEKATLTLGSNAAFHVKKWKTAKKKGVFRMLFGRFRAKAKGLVGGEQFNVKTATATIGIKGTEYTASVTPQGDVMLVVSESVVSLGGQEGAETAVKPDLLAVVINGQQASDAALIPQEVAEELTSDDLDSPFVTSEEAKALPAEEALIEVGLVNPKDLANAKREKADYRDSIEIDEELEPLDLRYRAEPDVYKDLLEKRLFIQMEI